jgi:hypothetical protein
MLRFLLPLILSLGLLLPARAGTSDVDSLILSPEATDTNSLLIQNDSGSAKVTVTKAGDATFAGGLTASGAVAISGAQTITADMTLSGNGIDILFNAANQNTVGAAAAGAKAVFTRALTGETGTALTISAGSGVTNSAVNTMTGGGIALTATSAPAVTSSTGPGLLWLHDATANNGCGGACTNHKLYCFINGTWTALH